MLLLDQRGTGHSSPISAEALAQLTAPQQAKYLSQFRADSIVRDAEYIREVLSPGRPWSLLGQSFGGFAASPTSPCSRTVCTRSTSPAGWPHLPPCRRGLPRHLPAGGRQEPRLLRALPHAQAIANRLANHLHSHEVRLPNGQRLTVEQLQQQGLDLGASGAFEELYYLLEDAFIGERLNPAFLYQVQAMQPFNTNPVFAILHESIYCEGAPATGQ